MSETVVHYAAVGFMALAALTLVQMARVYWRVPSQRYEDFRSAMRTMAYGRARSYLQTSDHRVFNQFLWLGRLLVLYALVCALVWYLSDHGAAPTG